MTTAYPLDWPEGWPRTPEGKRESRSRFSTTFDAARRNLMNELRMLGARSIVISSWVPLRNDGLPRSDMSRRRIEDPGVAVYFTLRGRPMVIARDNYWNVHDNLRSIGHAISHLRGLERHGGAHMMERAFSGFTALPPPAAAPVKRSWREVLGLVGFDGPAFAVLAGAEAAYRTLAKTAHPDSGGGADAMAELNTAIAEAREELKP